jgi:putative ABC transport system permease protein
MRAADVLRCALASLFRHKLRTLLTLSGVVVGTFLLVVSTSIGLGTERATLDEFKRQGRLRKIEVWPNFGRFDRRVPSQALEIKEPMSEAKRERLKRARARFYARSQGLLPPEVPITLARLEAIEKLPHVESAIPYVVENCQVIWKGPEQPALVSVIEPDNQTFRDRLLAGSFDPDTPRREVVIHEYLLYLWGITRDEDVASMLGKPIYLTQKRRNVGSPMTAAVLSTPLPGFSHADIVALARLLRRVEGMRGWLGADEREVARKVGTELEKNLSVQQETTIYHKEFTIAAVIREWMESDDKTYRGPLDALSRDVDVFIPQFAAREMLQGDPRRTDRGFSRVTVSVDSEEAVKEVHDAIKAMGLNCFSLQEVLEKVRRGVLLLTLAAILLAAMALVVAAVGITNTMLMSVLERTHEIGVMKAVGARSRDVSRLFLVEGLLLGLIGSALGLLLGWLCSLPGDQLARVIVEKHTGTKLEQSLFVYPLWLLLGVPAFVLLVTTLAAVYPARRAAGVDPIQALRHE